MPELIVYIVTFITLSGLMAAVEAAILSVSRAEVEELRLQKAWGAVALKAIKQRLTHAVVVLVIITNTINVLGPILSGRKAIQIYGDAAIVPVTAVLTLGTIVLSEIIPKSLGAHYAPQLSRVMAPVIRLLTLFLYPVVIGLEALSNFFKTGKRHIGTEAQIRSLVSIGPTAPLPIL
jgi:Mg2+/Co2+ transporter CorB